MSSTAFDIAVLQMNSGEDKAANVETALRLIDEAAATGARFSPAPGSRGRAPGASPVPPSG